MIVHYQLFQDPMTVNDDDDDQSEVTMDLQINDDDENENTTSSRIDENQSMIDDDDDKHGREISELTRLLMESNRKYETKVCRQHL
jgi:hypothetical protein